jgi:hypothetical protein
MTTINTLAIYGDSFAYRVPQDTLQVAWHQRFLEDFPGGVDNYGQMGSSFQYSFGKFLATHENYTKIIFCVTGNNRIHLPLLDHEHWTGINNIELFERTHDLDHDSRRTLAFLKEYYYHMTHTELSNQYESERILSGVHYIRKLRPDAVLINCFQTYNPVSFTWSLYDISLNEMHLPPGTEDKRFGHLTKPSHTWVYDTVNHFIVTGQAREWKPNLTPHYTNIQDLERNIC